MALTIRPGSAHRLIGGCPRRHEDLPITATHCINGGKGGYKTDIVFIPDYRNGDAPYGVWTPQRLLVAPQWANSSDPDFDVGFVVLQPHDGENIQQVLGANRLGIDSGYQYLVRVTGYPDSADAPITCINWTSRQSATQLRFECGGYTGGTSGSPWVTHFDTRSRTGTIVGVIGGYQQGGDTPSVSYSAYLGSRFTSFTSRPSRAGPPAARVSRGLTASWSRSVEEPLAGDPCHAQQPRADCTPACPATRATITRCHAQDKRQRRGPKAP